VQRRRQGDRHVERGSLLRDNFADAATDDTGKPIANGARDTWITATALTTALNVSFMADNLALFGIVVGVALLLSGIGFIILAILAIG
jgi:hypothetical protein